MVDRERSGKVLRGDRFRLRSSPWVHTGKFIYIFESKIFIVRVLKGILKLFLHHLFCFKALK